MHGTDDLAAVSGGQNPERAREPGDDFEPSPLQAKTAYIVELVTSWLTTKHAEEMALPNPQSNRVRVTKPRAARGAAGCGASRSHCETAT